MGKLYDARMTEQGRAELPDWIRTMATSRPFGADNRHPPGRRQQVLHVAQHVAPALALDAPRVEGLSFHICFTPDKAISLEVLEHSELR